MVFAWRVERRTKVDLDVFEAVLCEELWNLLRLQRISAINIGVMTGSDMGQNVL